MAKRIGVLGLQGCINPHLTHLGRIGAATLTVRCREELLRCDGLIIPGGESTTMLRLLERMDLWNPLKAYGEHHAVWGICAGSILAAKEVVSPPQASLGWIDIKAHRNFYGSQRESFREAIEIPALGRRLLVDFIRAPKLEALSGEVAILAAREGQPVLMRRGKILVSAFHTELGNDSSLHEYFSSIV